MNKLLQLERAKKQGYIIGSCSIIESIQSQFYQWCADNIKPYITITTRTKYSHLSVDTPNAKLQLNENGISAVEAIMEYYIDTTGTYSIGNEVIVHNNVPIKVAEKLAIKIIEIFRNKDNLETQI